MSRDNNRSEKAEEPKLKQIVEGADSLSLGISIVVAILIGVGIGLWLQSIFQSPYLLWLGVFWGVVAAGVNIYKAYKKELLAFEKIANDPRYKIQREKEEEKS
jgi:F0F1-type ATP synthase assembly protein I